MWVTPQIHILTLHFTSLCVTPFFSICSRFIFPPFTGVTFHTIPPGSFLRSVWCVCLSLHSSFWSSVRAGDLMLSLLIVPRLKISSGFVLFWESSVGENYLVGWVFAELYQCPHWSQRKTSITSASDILPWWSEPGFSPGVVRERE